MSQAIFSYLENVDWGGIRWGEYSFSGWLGSILWLPPTIRQEIIEKLLINFPEKMDDVEFSSSQESLVRIKDLLPNELVIKLQQALDVLNTNPNSSLRPGF